MVAGGGTSTVGSGSGNGASTTGAGRGLGGGLTTACTGRGATAAMTFAVGRTGRGLGFTGATTGDAGAATGVPIGNVGDGVTTGVTGSGFGATTAGRGALIASRMLCSVLPTRGLGRGAGAGTVPVGDAPFAATPDASCASRGTLESISAAPAIKASGGVKSSPEKARRPIPPLFRTACQAPPGPRNFLSLRFLLLAKRCG